MCFQPGLLFFYHRLVVGYRQSGVCVDDRFYLSMVVVCCCLSRVGCRQLTVCRLSDVAVSSCCWFLVVVGSWMLLVSGCWFLVVVGSWLSLVPGCCWFLLLSVLIVVGFRLLGIGCRVLVELISTFILTLHSKASQRIQGHDIAGVSRLRMAIL